jgi:hypothetical protein
MHLDQMHFTCLYVGSGVQRSKHEFSILKELNSNASLPQDFHVTFGKLLLQNSIFSFENTFKNAFLWGLL